MSSIKLNEYKQEIASLYDRRSKSYNDSDWHRQICDRLNQFDKSQLKQIKAEFDAELEAMATKSGIWNEIPTWYILGRKSSNSH